MVRVRISDPYRAYLYEQWDFSSTPCYTLLVESGLRKWMEIGISNMHLTQPWSQPSEPFIRLDELQSTI